MTTPRKILIAGCGYVGIALGMRLARAGDRVWGLRRNPGRIPESIQPLEADLRDAQRMQSLKIDVDAVVYCAGPASSSETAYRGAYIEGLTNLLLALEHSPKPVRRLIFVSSTRVYDQTGGEWVNEDSPVSPKGFRQEILLEGESLVRASGLDSIIVRFGGIYGPGRPGALDRALAGLAVSIQGQAIYGNRIHRDDCAGILLHLLNLKEPRPLYIGADCDPCSREEIRAWLSHRIGRKIPGPELENGQLERGNKRCSNQRILQSGYTFAYPTFREGFGALLSGEAFAGW